jgi:hypothetical protein
MELLLRYRTKFLKRLTPGLFFNAYSKVKNPKVVSFLRAPGDLEGLRSKKKLIFQKAQIKVWTINSNILL